MAEKKGICQHEVWTEDETVYLANDNDGYYLQSFETAKEIDEFINKLTEARDSVFKVITKGASNG